MRWVFCCRFESDVYAASGAKATEHSENTGSGIPVAFSDADDHALMDDKGDLPDQLEPRALLTSDAADPVAAVPLRVDKASSAITSPPSTNRRRFQASSPDHL